MRLTADPIPRLVRAIAVPAGTGLLFVTLFNFVDSYWAGVWSTAALAALAVSFPIYFVVIAASAGFGQGGTALIAHALGAGRAAEAARLGAQAVLLALLLGTAIGIGGVVLAPTLAGWLGATGESRELAVAYLRPVLAAAAVFLLISVANALLAAQGDTRAYRNALGVGALLNVGLDPLLMFGVGPLPGIGFAGIAAATVGLQTLQLAYLLHRARRTALGRSLRLVDLRPAPALLRALLRQGTPSFLTFLATGVGLAMVTSFVARHGPAAVAAYGLGLRLEQLAMLPAIGLNAAAVSLVGQNNGAGLPDRVRAATRSVLLAGIGMMAAGALVVGLLRRPLLALFTADPAVIELGAGQLAITVTAMPAYAVIILGAAVLQGLRRPLFGFLVGVGRQVLALPLVLWLLDVRLGLGLVGIWIGVVASAWVAALVTAAWLGARFTRLMAPPRAQAA